MKGEGPDRDLDLLVVLDHVDPADRPRLVGAIRRAVSAPRPVSDATRPASAPGPPAKMRLRRGGPGGLTAAMTDVRTARLGLHAVDAAEARRIHDRAPDGSDAWAPDYPFDGDLRALGGFLQASEQHGEQRPFGYYQLTRRADGLAIGGIGFIGPPAAGVVEIGYGLAPGARGHGYAAEALSALLTIARDHGVSRVRADTDPDNIASRKTLRRAGFEALAADADLHHFEIRL